jgi:hypothetical protein
MVTSEPEPLSCRKCVSTPGRIGWLIRLPIVEYGGNVRIAYRLWYVSDLSDEMSSSSKVMKFFWCHWRIQL